MSLSVCCTSCGHLYENLKAELVGKKVRCKCGCKMVVPAASVSPLHSQPLAQTIPAQTGYLPPTRNLSSTPQKSRRVRRRQSEKGNFRPVDFIYMIGGGIVFASGIQAVFGLLGSFLAMPRLFAVMQNAPEGSSSFMPSFMGMMALGLVQSVMSALLGFLAGAMAYYVYQKRVQGESEYGWAFGYSAIAAVANLLLSFVLAGVLMISTYSTARGGTIPIGFSFASLFVAPLPVFVLVLYGMRHHLGFKELGSK